MKKIFLAKRNALLSAAPWSWGAAALLFALFALGLRFTAPNAFWQLLTPVFQLSDIATAQTHWFFSSFGNTAELTVSNEKLQTANTQLVVENQTLREQLKRIALLAPSSGGIVAAVVARPPQSPYDTLVVAGGARAGVTLGMEAFVPPVVGPTGGSGIPIGVVSSVDSAFSRVTLFSAPGVVTAGWVGSSTLPITLQGAGAGAFNATIARAARVADGDIVYVPGPGLRAVGSVVRIDSDMSEPGVILRIQSAYNLFSTVFVELRATRQ